MAHNTKESKDSRSLSEFKRKIINGMEILASADYEKFLLKIMVFIIIV